MLLLFLLFSAGCSSTGEEAATLTFNPNSDYTNTFRELHLGNLSDFNFKLNHADKRWVNLWVEQYIDGEKEPDPLVELSYGNSPNEVEEGNLGLGIIDTGEDYLAFLYGPSVSMKPTSFSSQTNSAVLNSALSFEEGEEIKLETGETRILAAYSETDSSIVSTMNLQNEALINKMIKEREMVLLLKIKIEDDPANE